MLLNIKRNIFQEAERRKRKQKEYAEITTNWKKTERQNEDTDTN